MDRLAAFLPKLRGYGDIPYDQQYRGAIALAKRHFFPTGKALTKKELMALLLQSYQEKRELTSKCQTQPQPTKTLGIQTSLETIDGSSHIVEASGGSAPCVHSAACTNTPEIPTEPESSIELPNKGVVELEHTSSASGTDPDLGNEDNHDMVSGPETEPAQLVACTPVAPRSFNPYMTPISNPRYPDHAASTLSLRNESPTPASTGGSHVELTFDEDSPATDEGIGELLQATATSQVVADSMPMQITFLEGQKEGIQREFDLTKRKLDETEQRLREANGDRWKLNRLVDKLHRRIDSIYNQLGMLRGIMDPEDTDNEKWSVYNAESQEGFDPNSI
ncbi:hypothetical protein JVT61DRAFT_265 [Boletus reticuloceps]|uniref:Uncharacterized protein n=1 Tax=Boletus reticuloceps TaxID=495285 RepID=A0A8I2YYE9_9AGAM|nr:hypothetical protein JVT61DRAFT_265 [Boletus reticuloceps]